MSGCIVFHRGENYKWEKHMVFVTYKSKRSPCYHNVEDVYLAIAFNSPCHSTFDIQTTVILNHV